MHVKSKHDQIYEHVVSLLKKSEAGDVLPCEADIAAKLQVNRMSVSKVMAALKSQGYITRKQGVGSIVLRRFLPEIPGVISVLPGPASEISSPYFAKLMGEIAAECVNRGYVNVFTGCPTAKAGASFDYDALNSLTSSGRYAGAIILDTKLKHLQEWKERFAHPELPVVWMSMPPGWLEGANCVDDDSRAAASALVERLHARGFRKIGFVSGQFNTAHRRERFEGYKNSLAKLGLEFSESRVFIEEGDNLFDCGRKAAERLLSMTEAPDALLAADAMLCKGMKEFAAGSGRASAFVQTIATFDYEFPGEIDNVAVAAIQPFERMARAAVELLVDIAAKKIETPACRVFHAKLVERNNGEIQ